MKPSTYLFFHKFDYFFDYFLSSSRNILRTTLNLKMPSYGLDTPIEHSNMEIEYVDQIDNTRKYCQLKSGPTTINKDDIKTIEHHFMGLRNLARTNHLAITTNDPVVGVLYGSHRDLSTMYKTIQNDGYNVLVGEEFWLHLTGYKDLYKDLVNQAQITANNSAMQQSVDKFLCTVKQGIEQSKDFFGI
ncbi:PmeII family type II restriction endonuclease [Oenococcus oeni]|uniref:PmeII family type II restriction endonuclease n=1 Tax=Oenococcus oeni TaxID=1247 RepID=UPI001955486B|nr:PmeII family type II restriction endonuclease [Oenococcus oeni]